MFWWKCKRLTSTTKKIPSVTGLGTTNALHTKATEIESKINAITNLATKVVLSTTEIECKIPDYQNCLEYKSHRDCK